MLALKLSDHPILRITPALKEYRDYKEYAEVMKGVNDYLLKLPRGVWIEINDIPYGFKTRVIERLTEGKIILKAYKNNWIKLRVIENKSWTRFTLEKTV